MNFKITSSDNTGMSRCGVLSFPYGDIHTPAFAPVATRGSVKGLTSEDLYKAGTQFLLANAYHLELRPGSERVEAMGGLHEFMSWNRPIITDSGGYQVFSLSELREVSDEGVSFRSPIDGASMFLGPRESIAIQNRLGSDVAMCFDECPPCPCEYDVARNAVERTLKWAAICRETHGNDGQALFGIVQGSMFEDLRSSCAERLVEMEFDGYAIGGVSVGEEEELRNRVVRYATPLLPEDRPRYLMGVGFPPDILYAVEQGVDLFDCVAPSRMGRNATAFTTHGRVRLRNSQHKKDPSPIMDGCACPACRLYSRDYISHLFRSKEMLGPILVTAHNIYFYNHLLAQARVAIKQNRFKEFRTGFLENYLSGDEK
jgi:queuine tRNA-ribosyltransferase